MNVTRKLSALLVIFLTLGMTAVAAVTAESPSVDPEFTQNDVSPSYTLQADYSGFNNDNLAQTTLLYTCLLK